MNSASKYAVTALLVFCLAGCAPNNAKTAPPPQAQAPTTTAVPTAGKAGAMYPPPLTESQTQSEPATSTPAPVVATSEPEPAPPPTPPPATKKSTSHKSKPSAAKPSGSDTGAMPATGTDAATATGTGAGTSTGETPEVAATGQPAAASPIGELTPADTPEQFQKGKDTNDLISKTEDGVNGIKRPLTTQEQETVNQIKAFLTKAKTALGIEDYDGAYVLATKAKVLLDELNKT